jgi:hypothetical protein
LPNAGSDGANTQSQLDDTPLAALGALAERAMPAQPSMDDGPCEGQPAQPSMFGGPMEGVIAALADTPTDDEQMPAGQKPAGEKPTKQYQLQPPASPPERKSPTDDEALLQEVPPGLKGQAIKNFARARSLKESQVTWGLVAGSHEGAIYWASEDLNMGAQSAMVQRMKRALPEVL